MKSFNAPFGDTKLDLHKYLGIDERVHPLDELLLDGYSFFDACAAGRKEVVIAFLLAGFDVNATEVNSTRNNFGYTGLHYAAGSGNTELLSLLCAEGANVDARSAASGLTPLMVALAAVGRGGHDTVRFLIAQGADPRKVDDEGDPALFFAAKSPVALEIMRSLLGLEFSSVRNSKGETVLHQAARGGGGRNAILYLAEMTGIDVNTRSNDAGDTALHIAATEWDVDAVKALMNKGADANLANNAGATPMSVRGCLHRGIMAKCSKDQSNRPKLEQLTKHDASNWSQLDGQQVQQFLVPFILPNVIMYLGSFAPIYIGVLITFTSMVGFMVVGNFAMKQPRRSLATAGWFSGALVTGSWVLLTRVFPVLTQHNPQIAPTVIAVWWIVTTLMFYNYAKAVLSSPGVVPSTADARREIISTVARDGDVAIQRENYDMTTFVRKPLRSKHCTKTHATVYRFDHFCIWTGNAIGGGNHRPFVWYCLYQTISQTIVMWSTIAVVFYYSPQDSGFHETGISAWFLWLFTAQNTLITYFLLFYNSFVILFVASVVLTQLWYASRNVTSNDVWFPDRYPWLMSLGSRVYCLYDQGPYKNLLEFFWSGNLCQDHYTLPKMSEYLQKKSRSFAAQVRSSQYSKNGEVVNPGASHGQCASGNCQHAHGGQPAAGGAGSGTVAIDVPSQDTAAANPTAPPPAEINAEDEAAQSRETFSELQQQLPKERQNDAAVLQDMVKQLNTGADSATVPAGVPVERHAEFQRKAQMMHKQLQAALRRNVTS